MQRLQKLQVELGQSGRILLKAAAAGASEAVIRAQKDEYSQFCRDHDSYNFLRSK